MVMSQSTVDWEEPVEHTQRIRVWHGTRSWWPLEGISHVDTEPEKPYQVEFCQWISVANSNRKGFLRSKEYYLVGEAEVESGHCWDKNTNGYWLVGRKTFWVDILEQKAINETREIVTEVQKSGWCRLGQQICGGKEIENFFSEDHI